MGLTSEAIFFNVCNASFSRGKSRRCENENTRGSCSGISSPGYSYNFCQVHVRSSNEAQIPVRKSKSRKGAKKTGARINFFCNKKNTTTLLCQEAEKKNKRRKKSSSAYQVLGLQVEESSRKVSTPRVHSSVSKSVDASIAPCFWLVSLVKRDGSRRVTHTCLARLAAEQNPGL